ncbi:MAG TPA: hypothetical protein VMI12_09045 [Puia sp.]|nr:hypothetical protein [Puia sp.]
MLTPEEKDFIHYWEQNRLKQKKIFRQLLLGIPLGLLFVIPILINFASGWYKRAEMVANTQDFNPGVLMAACLLIIGFVAIFSRKVRWEKNEQYYQELRSKMTEEKPDKEKKD